MENTIFGIFNEEEALHFITPFLFLMARNYIHCTKWCYSASTLDIFLSKIKHREKVEKINAFLLDNLDKHKQNGIF